MIPGVILNYTRFLGRPEGWAPEAGQHCDALAIRDETGSVPHMTSAWVPTAEELARIAAGASVVLVVAGTAHPPVMLMVGEPPEPITADGQHPPSAERHWLARQLLDSTLSDEEAFSVVRYHPSIKDVP